jgi:hypothetical protein
MTRAKKHVWENITFKNSRANPVSMGDAASPAPDGCTLVTSKPLNLEWVLTFRQFALFLGCLVLCSFWDVLFWGKALFYRDFQLFAYPWAHFFRECFWRGEMPLWNPYNNCGLPFLAQWNTMTLYPLSLFYLVFPLSWSLSAFCILHLYLGGLGMFLLARRWTGNAWGGALAGIAFAFSGLMLNSLTWSNNVAALGWMPWVVLWAVNLKDRRTLAQAAFIGAMQMLTGAPEIIFMTWLLVACFWGLDFISTQNRVRAKNAALLVILVAGLCAMQLLPFLQLLANSHRDPKFAEASNWPMPLWGLANFFTPLFFTMKWSQNVFFQYNQYWTCSYFIPLGGLMFAGFALWKTRDKRVWLLGLVAGLSIWAAMGDPAGLYLLVKGLFPGLGFMRYPIKLMVMATFALPLLAAFGLKQFWNAQDSLTPGSKRAFVLLAAGALGIIAFLTWYCGAHPRYNGEYDTSHYARQNGLARAILLTLFVLGAVFISPKFPIRLRVLIRFSLLLLAWYDGISHSPNIVPRTERWVFDSIDVQTRGTVFPLRGDGRVMVSPEAEQTMFNLVVADGAKELTAKRMALYCNLNLLDAVPKVNGVFSLQLRAMEPLLQSFSQPNGLTEPMLDFFGVTHLTTRGSTMSWNARPTAMRMVSSGQRPAFATDLDCLKLLQAAEFRPAKVACFSEELRGAMEASPYGAAEIGNFKQTGSKIEFESTSPEPALAVIAQAFYPCWKATMDGKPTPILKANLAFQAIELPPGHHVVTLSYVDYPFLCGVAISFVTLLICLGLHGWKSRKENRFAPA